MRILSIFFRRDKGALHLPAGRAKLSLCCSRGAPAPQGFELAGRRFAARLRLFFVFALNEVAPESLGKPLLFVLQSAQPARAGIGLDRVWLFSHIFNYLKGNRRDPPLYNKAARLAFQGFHRASARRRHTESARSLHSPSSRKPHCGYPGSQQAPAFVTIPDNASGISGMTDGE
jgi:hypothetical protein